MGSSENTTTMIHEMVDNMNEEVTLTKEVGAITESLFRKQMTQAFDWPHGPESYWHEIEHRWRELTGEPIPGKYRSNKSVILKAHKHTPRIDEWSEGDGVIGKTAVQSHFSGGVKLTKESAYRQVIRIIEKVRTDSGNDEHDLMCHDLLVYLAGEDEV